MKSWPVFPTIIVAAAVATMMALGIWQLDRKGEKEAALAVMEANRSRPPMAFPELAPVSDDTMYRSSSANCLEIVGWRERAGTDHDGKSGVLYIAECRTGAEGPGFLAAMGVSDRPNVPPAWRGGEVAGTIIREPDPNSFLHKLFSDIPPLRPMLVASNPPEGFRQAARPNPSSVTNNHLSYAIQWFFFAFAAAVIFLLAVRKKMQTKAPQQPSP